LFSFFVQKIHWEFRLINELSSSGVHNLFSQEIENLPDEQKKKPLYDEEDLLENLNIKFAVKTFKVANNEIKDFMRLYKNTDLHEIYLLELLKKISYLS
jgi:hypothetical protein